MEFKKGDKVVCIDVADSGGLKLQLYNTYTIETHIITKDDDNMRSFIFLQEIGGIFADNRFISLLEFRKQKMKNILYKKN